MAQCWVLHHNWQDEYLLAKLLQNKSRVLAYCKCLRFIVYLASQALKMACHGTGRVTCRLVLCLWCTQPGHCCVLGKRNEMERRCFHGQLTMFISRAPGYIHSLKQHLKHSAIPSYLGHNYQVRFMMCLGELRRHLDWSSISVETDKEQRFDLG